METRTAGRAASAIGRCRGFRVIHRDFMISNGDDGSIVVSPRTPDAMRDVAQLLEARCEPLDGTWWLDDGRLWIETSADRGRVIDEFFWAVGEARKARGGSATSILDPDERITVERWVADDAGYIVDDMVAPSASGDQPIHEDFPNPIRDEAVRKRILSLLNAAANGTMVTYAESLLAAVRALRRFGGMMPSFGCEEAVLTMDRHELAELATMAGCLASVLSDAVRRDAAVVRALTTLLDGDVKDPA